MADERKKYLLRIPHALYDVYEQWADDDLRSVNAQIEAVLTDAARRAGRLKRPSRVTPHTQDTDEPETNEPNTDEPETDEPDD